MDLSFARSLKVDLLRLQSVLAAPHDHSAACGEGERPTLVRRIVSPPAELCLRVDAALCHADMLEAAIHAEDGGRDEKGDDDPAIRSAN